MDTVALNTEDLEVIRCALLAAGIQTRYRDSELSRRYFTVDDKVERMMNRPRVAVVVVPF